MKRCKIITNIMPTHFKISLEPGIRELFLKHILHDVTRPPLPAPEN